MFIWLCRFRFIRWCRDYVYSVSQYCYAVYSTYKVTYFYKNIFNNIVTDIIKNNVETKNNIKDKILLKI
jgi:hypothetical protein